jgi:dTDP-4-amino-4,6-dideoxygalactose transaminase
MRFERPIAPAGTRAQFVTGGSDVKRSYDQFGGRVGDCPVTESVSDRLLRPPFYNGLQEPEQARVVELIRSFPL